MADLTGGKNKVQAVVTKEDSRDAFIKIDIKLEPLRADISYSLRQKHYTEAVRALVNALDQASIDLEEGDGRTVAGNIGMSEFRN